MIMSSRHVFERNFIRMSIADPKQQYNFFIFKLTRMVLLQFYKCSEQFLSKRQQVYKKI